MTTTKSVADMSDAEFAAWRDERIAATKSTPTTQQQQQQKEPKDVRGLSPDEYRAARADLVRGGPVRRRDSEVSRMTPEQYAMARAELIGRNGGNHTVPAGQSVLKLSSAEYEAAKAKLIRDSANT